MLEYWNAGPPWRDKNGVGLLHCIISLTEILVLKFGKSGLGQGIMGDLVLSNVKEEKWEIGLLGVFFLTHKLIPTASPFAKGD